MNPITSPLNDKFDTIIEKLAHDEASSWDTQSLLNYAADSLATRKKSWMSTCDMIEAYEDFYKKSIVHEIDYFLVNPEPVIWTEFVSAEYQAVVKMADSPPELVNPEGVSSDRILCWSICLRNADGQYKEILNIDADNEDEAVEIVNSINSFFYSSLD